MTIHHKLGLSLPAIGGGMRMLPGSTPLKEKTGPPPRERTKDVHEEDG